MKRINYLLSILSVALFGLFLTSCDDDNTPVKPVDSSIKTIKNADSHVWDAWTYVSLKDNKIVATNVKVGEDLKDSSWDIAFHREQIRVNDANFAGKGAAQLLADATELSKDLTLGNNWITNSEGDLRVGMNMTDPSNMYTITKAFFITDSNYNSYEVNMGAMGNPEKMYPFRKSILAIRGVDGTSVYLIKITSSLSETGKGGYISFDYMQVK